ncbi:helix-turn-helix domain-containing protein [Streptomyces sp. MNP-20]|uniref:TetR/AcrR family transcriptional regulator n=1 Tax=Streptomyces sp. MNP-20 TaxID=2721165 RepID=UPI0028163542|nr:helix-turn-helix domain-containing protein [Streptomyces sp. MNP-20]
MAADRLSEALDATYACLSRYGVRRTTVDDIAREMGVSRSAVYQYVRGKDDAVRKLAMRLHDRALARAEAAAVAPVPPAERVHGILAAKLDLVLDLTGRSPHAVELLDPGARLSGDICDAFTARLRALLTEQFAAVDREVAAGRATAADREAAADQAVEAGREPAPGREAAEVRDAATDRDAAAGLVVALGREAAADQEVAAGRDVVAPGREAAEVRDVAAGLVVAPGREAAEVRDAAAGREGVPGRDAAAAQAAAAGPAAATGRDAAAHGQAAASPDPVRAGPGEPAALAPTPAQCADICLALVVGLETAPDAARLLRPATDALFTGLLPHRTPPLRPLQRTTS